MKQFLAMFIPIDTYQSILQCMPILCVDVLIIRQAKCLLLLRDNEPAKGKYWFPGGRVHKNESIRDAALRKAKEETNLSCSFIKIISTEESMFKKTGNMLTDIHTVNVCCLLEPQSESTVETDALHNGFIWMDKLSAHFHPAIIHPLTLLGFTF